MPLQWLTNHPSFPSLSPLLQPTLAFTKHLGETLRLLLFPCLRCKFDHPSGSHFLSRGGGKGKGGWGRRGCVCRMKGREGGANSVWWQNRWKPFKTVSPRSALGPSLTELPRISWLSLSRRIMHYRFSLHLPFCSHPLTGQATQQESSGTISVPFVTTLSGKARAWAILNSRLDWYDNARIFYSLSYCRFCVHFITYRPLRKQS